MYIYSCEIYTYISLSLLTPYPVKAQNYIGKQK